VKKTFKSFREIAHHLRTQLICEKSEKAFKQ